MSDQPITINEAARLTGLSVPTLRRRIAEGTLKPETRASNNAPIRLTVAALEMAGLSIQDEKSATQAEIEALRSKVEEAAREIEQLREAVTIGREQIANLKGEIRGRREVEEMLAGQIRAALEMAAKAQIEQSRPVIDQPARRRRWSRNKAI